jgi:Beta-ketoacyl synthase, C-terminal domain
MPHPPSLAIGAEAKAISDAFGDHAEHLLVSSTKSMTGHLLGAAGSLEAGLTVLALRDQVAPPTTNVREVDDACRFRLIRDKALGTTLDTQWPIPSASVEKCIPHLPRAAMDKSMADRAVGATLRLEIRWLAWLD